MTILQNVIGHAPTTQRAAGIASAAGIAAVVLAGFGFAGAAQARDNVQFSVQIGSPGYAYPVYSQPQVVYVQPQPVYVQPRPVYVQPAPVYYQGPPTYYSPAPVTYGYPGLYPNGRPHGYRNGHGHGNNGWKHNRGGYYLQPQQGYGQVYYQR